MAEPTCEIESSGLVDLSSDSDPSPSPRYQDNRKAKVGNLYGETNKICKNGMNLQKNAAVCHDANRKEVWQPEDIVEIFSFGVLVAC